MKNFRSIFLVLVGVMAIFPIITHAESITNNNGIVISEEEYNNFLKIHTHEYIMLLEKDQYAKLKDLDYSTIKSDTVYVETTYNPSLGITTEKEITEEEYNNPTMPMSGGATETTSKKLTISVIDGSNYKYVTETASWKVIPSTRSFDVIGVRGQNLSVRNGSQVGEQIYVVNGTYKKINYAWNGTNIKRFDNGFGISMNLVDDTIQSIQLTIDCDLSQTASTATLFGSYQHATKTTTLAESQSYTLGSSGLGNVFSFPYNTAIKYDGMQGVSVYY